MLSIKRTDTPANLSETDKAFQKHIEGMDTKEAYDFYQKKKHIYKYNTDETKQKFKEMNYERCSFCTKFISDFDDEMTIEHIKIKRDFPGEIFRWENLLCACRTCNTKRSTKPYDKEKYLDPTKVHNIEQYFSFMLDGKIIPNKELDEQQQLKAKHMIEMYVLDRDNLNRKRKEFLKDLLEDESYYKSLKDKDVSSQNIIFSSVFAYYRRCIE